MTFGITLKIFFLRKIDKKTYNMLSIQIEENYMAQNAFVHANSDMSFNVNVTSFDNLSMNI